MTVRLPAWLQSGSYSAETDRSVGTALLSTSSALGGRGGVRYYAGTEFQVKQSGPAAMTVDVTAGMAFVPGSFTLTQGTYTVVNDATFTTTISAASLVNPRIDLVILEVLDQVYTGSSNLAQVRVVTGTAAPTPAVPTVTGTNYIPLAQVFVPTNAVSIVTANITDLRPFTGLLNQPIPVRSLSERNSLPLVEGLKVYRLDNGWEVNTYSAGNWYGQGDRLFKVNNFSTYSNVFGTRTIVDRVKIPDPGFVYMLELMYDNEVSNARVNATVYCEATNTTNVSNLVATGQSLSSWTLEGGYNRVKINYLFASTYTGNRWVTIKYATDGGDSGNGWCNDSYMWTCQIRLIPVLPSSFTSDALTGGVP